MLYMPYLGELDRGLVERLFVQLEIKKLNAAREEEKSLEQGVTPVTEEPIVGMEQMVNEA